MAKKDQWEDLLLRGGGGKVVSCVMTRIQPDGCWQDALEEYDKKRDALYAGREYREDNANVLTVGRLCNDFLNYQLGRLQSANPEITSRTFIELRGTTDRLIAVFGRDRAVDDLNDRDFEKLRAKIAGHWGPVRLGNEIGRVKSVFKYGRKSDIVSLQFKKPTRRILRTHRAGKAKRLFEAAEIHALLDVAPAQLRAMILLGINCGFGNNDCGTIAQSVIDLEAGLIEYTRPKTGIERRCPIWPQTIEALKTAIDARPDPKDTADAALVPQPT